ncbi:hypothetical protein SDRG_08161 [Saprolegnia diclina VS20]|uniref:Calponin-homology (CH) domain-containing protein n=1 Tax=Saprolegnia diclina (strain VS20) TaxID=1156394 RepID=T0QI30_SAPDV|nr:hypothetical protein SDRG_08161 [Saprolegnia diclina VS20]EQC34391.1 hypothetical protein SDRG_08161 [Saprolegnia diclina VS20]|eukprot:XP_008612253.1 hypothetical protein SDRG_08161 [Saprolegnia diclina VS20]
MTEPKRGLRKATTVSLRRLKETPEVEAPSRPATMPPASATLSPLPSRPSSHGEMLVPEPSCDTRDALRRPKAVLSTRCFGCGGLPEMCLHCFSNCKKNDMTKYKQSLAKGVEWLFVKATSRAFSHLSDTITQWVFGMWKFYCQQKKLHRQYALRLVERQRLKRVMSSWRIQAYDRRAYGALVYAQGEHTRVVALEAELNALQGTLTDLKQEHQVRAHLDADKMAKLHGLIQEEKQRVVDKNKELAAIKGQLAIMQASFASLEAKAEKAEMLTALQAELFDYKKVCFQMSHELISQMERQVDEFALYDGRQYFNDVLSNDVVNSLDLMENPILYDPSFKLNKDVRREDREKAKKEIKKVSPINSAPVDRADRILMQWVNYLLLKKSPPDWLKATRISNCNTNLQDGKAYAVVTRILHDAMCNLRPRKKTYEAALQRENGVALTDQAAERYLTLMINESDDQRRLELMLNTIGQAMWLPSELVKAQDIMAGDSDFNLVLLGYLFCTSPPVVEETHTEHCNTLMRQLTLERAQWREFKEKADANDVTSAVSKKIKLALAHLLEMKKRLDTEVKKAHDGHVIWWKSSRVVLRKCFLTLSMMAHGKSGFMVAAEKAADNEGFLLVPHDRIGSILFDHEDAKWEIDMLQGYLNSVYNDLSRIYRSYASRGATTEVGVMSYGGLLELLSECNIPDNNFALKDMEGIFAAVTDTKPDNTADGDAVIVDVNRALLPAEFIEALIRIARKRYSGQYKTTALSESFCLLVDNQILPYAYQNDAEKFQKQMESPGLRNMLIKYQDDMKALFTRYSVDQGKKKTKTTKMTAYTLMKFVSDRSLEDDVFTNERALQVVGHAVRARAISKTELMQQEITFDAFQETMVAMACHKNPDPYVSVENRFQKFATMYIVSAA